MTTDQLPSTEVDDPIIPIAQECQNCHAELSGSYCSQCGQESHKSVRHFYEYIQEVFDDWMALDSKFLRTLWSLIFRPGFLSNQYFIGRRVRYITPVRLFIIVNVLFFFLFPYLSDIRLDNTRDDSAADKEIIAQLDARINKLTSVDVDEIQRAKHSEYAGQLSELKKQLDESDKKSITRVLLEMTKVQIARQEPDYLLNADQVETLKDLDATMGAFVTDGAMLFWDYDEGEDEPAPEGLSPQKSASENTDLAQPSLAEKNLSKLGETETLNYEEQGDRTENDMAMKVARAFNDTPEKLASQAGDIISSSMFVLLPIYALLLKLCYLFKPRLYMEHLTIALHGQSFVFVVILVAMGFEKLAVQFPVFRDVLDGISTILIIWVPIYLLLLQHRAYKQTWGKTILMFWLTSTLYMALIILALFFAVILGVEML